MTGVEFQLCGSQALAVLDKACACCKEEKYSHPEKKGYRNNRCRTRGNGVYEAKTYIFPPVLYCPPGVSFFQSFPLGGDVFLALLSRLFFGIAKHCLHD